MPRPPDRRPVTAAPSERAATANPASIPAAARTEGGTAATAAAAGTNPRAESPGRREDGGTALEVGKRTNLGGAPVSVGALARAKVRIRARARVEVKPSAKVKAIAKVEIINSDAGPLWILPFLQNRNFNFMTITSVSSIILTVITTVISIKENCPHPNIQIATPTTPESQRGPQSPNSYPSNATTKTNSPPIPNPMHNTKPSGKRPWCAKSNLPREGKSSPGG
mmetsp:Transcript_26547/g.54988  ORF Transcript_26547/g.54988 Transcript_26547/m.54988 type:complete len:224 (+) Transcript_26547:817-1488(+)